MWLVFLTEEDGGTEYAPECNDGSGPYTGTHSASLLGVYTSAEEAERHAKDNREAHADRLADDEAWREPFGREEHASDSEYHSEEEDRTERVREVKVVKARLKGSYSNTQSTAHLWSFHANTDLEQGTVWSEF